MNIPSIGSSVKRFLCAGALVAGVMISMFPGERTCMRTTAYYYDWIWQASNNPDPGIGYDAIIADARSEMDSACNRVLTGNNQPTRERHNERIPASLPGFAFHAGN
jgi:hypothetical protein